MLKVDSPRLERLESQDDIGYLTGRHQERDAQGQIQYGSRRSFPAVAQESLADDEEEAFRDR
jgi:hypothetical protein